MKRRYLFLTLILILAFELIFTINMLDEDNYYKNNTIQINELVKKIESNYDDKSKYPNFCEYAILDENNNLVYKTDNANTTSINEAYKNKDTIVDFSYDDEKSGKIIIYNDFETTVANQRELYIKIIVVVVICQLLSFIIYYIYLSKNILAPFKRMKEFASRLSSGNLDIPLKMDRNNNFGAFTEAFDIMRCEIIKARNSEKKAVEDKKELVAKLSHDIKTPISSIKSYSELGYAVSKEEKSKEYFEGINHKSDQMSVMITNLFNSTLEELEELSINPEELNSNIVYKLIAQADYLKKGNIADIPKCSVYADRLRLQQVLDNIYANSYKYAGTKIETEAYIEKDNLVISIRDFGDTLKEEELPLLTEKFKRGSNTKNIDGTGLGLYISKELLKNMNGNLEVESAKPGFKVLIYLRLK